MPTKGTNGKKYEGYIGCYNPGEHTYITYCDNEIPSNIKCPICKGRMKYIPHYLDERLNRNSYQFEID